MAAGGALGGAAAGLAFGAASAGIKEGVPGAVVDGVKGAIDGAMNGAELAGSLAHSPGDAVVFGVFEGACAGMGFPTPTSEGLCVRPDLYPNDRLELDIIKTMEDMS